MLFVQALEKAQAKPIEHFKLRKKATIAVRESSIDSVDLSNASSHILNLTHSNAQDTSPTMELESALLQQALFYLAGLPIPMYSLTSLHLMDDDWDITFAKPPKVTPSCTNTHVMGYSNANRHLPTEIINYPFSIGVVTSDQQQYYFEIDIRVARFTQQKNHWPDPKIERIQLAPVAFSYDSSVLHLTKKQAAYFFDQDGDTHQASPIIEKMKKLPSTILLPDNPLLNGMRLWRCQQESVDIALIGDPYLGAIHTATHPF
ncbi:hypothetical protein CBF23_006885 [Marinomonas agarivorans]|nr:hypothetical protein CBF23_006885 [Marinomonas agarivorans]